MTAATAAGHVADEATRLSCQRRSREQQAAGAGCVRPARGHVRSAVSWCEVRPEAVQSPPEASLAGALSVAGVAGRGIDRHRPAEAGAALTGGRAVHAQSKRSPRGHETAGISRRRLACWSPAIPRSNRAEVAVHAGA